MVFQNREEAGQKLTEAIRKVLQVQKVPKEKVLVLAIPRGGVVIGKIVAQELGCALQVIVTKKIGAPGQAELAIGAMDPVGRVIWDENLLQSLNLDKDNLKQEIEDLRFKIKDYIKKFNAENLNLEDKTVIVVDDGIATGRTMQAAVGYLKAMSHKPRAIWVAVPVCAADTAQELKQLADEFVCLYIPPVGDFGAVGQFYREFPQVEDEEVKKILISPPVNAMRSIAGR